MAKLKVFNGFGFLRNVSGQVDIMVATTSQKKASELLDVSIGTIRDYFSVTGNDEDIAIATARPETIFYCKKNTKKWLEHKDNISGKYIVVPPKITKEYIDLYQISKSKIADSKEEAWSKFLYPSLVKEGYENDGFKAVKLTNKIYNFMQ